MAVAGAPARTLPPDRRETQRRPVGAPQRRPSVVRAPQRRRQSTMARLVVFGVLLAILAVGRVTLSFAVVQKNLQTDAVARRYRAIDSQNQQLSQTAASLSSALAVRNTAVNKYHLIVSPDVQFVTVHPAHAAKHSRR